PVTRQDCLLVVGTLQGQPIARLLDDQPRHHAAILHVSGVAEILLADQGARIDEADEQEITILPVGVREIRPDLLALAEELVAVAAVLTEKYATIANVAAAGPQVVVEPAHLGQLLLGRRDLQGAPVLADEPRDRFVLIRR